MANNSLPTYTSRRSPALNAIISFAFMIIAFVAFGTLPTQWFASKYSYDPNLGEALIRFHNFAVYSPTDWLSWGWRLADIEALKSNVHIMIMLGGGSIILAILFGVAIALWLGKYTNGMDGLHGTAHWADRPDVDKTGFINAKNYKSKGVVVGSVMLDRRGKLITPSHKKYPRRYKPKLKRGRGLFGFLRKEPVRDGNNRPMYELEKSLVKSIEIMRDGGNTHIFAFCPTRSGKGTGMVIPTLLTWSESVMVNDPKGEAYALTSGFRQSAGQHVIKYEPSCTDGTGARWNPLDEIRIFTLHDVSDSQMIMSMACDPEGKGLEDYFDKAGYEFMTALALHMRYAEKNGSLAGIALFLGDPNWDSDKQMYEHMKNAIHDPEGKMNWRDTLGKPTKTHPMVANAAQTMLNKEDKDRSGVLSTAKSLLSLYLDPIVALNTCCSDFLVRDLMTNEKAVSLYYVVGPSDMERMTPLTRLFYALFIRRNAADMTFADGRSAKNYTHPLLMIIDEATSLKKLPILQEALGYVAGYGIRLFMLVQDITQVEELYGDKQSFDSGAEVRIVYAPNKIETAEKLARMSGKTTITEENASKSRDIIGIKAGSVSLSTSKTARDLMTADEFMNLHDQDMVIFIKGQPPVYGRKAFYYENPILMGRASMPPPKRSAVLRIVENVEPVLEPVVEIKEETPIDKWAASREALRTRVASAVQMPTNTAADNSSTDSASSAPIGKPKSRYAAEVRELSPAEQEQIRTMVQDVVLLDKVTAVSAF
jgi:type IV secretion system protein VirD4